jgi:Domain of unknown function (DUF4328)
MSVISNDSVRSASPPSETDDRNRRIHQFRSNTLRTRLTQVLLMAQLVLNLIGSATESVNGAEPRHPWDTTFLQLLLAPITLAVFCAWMYRAYWNLIPLGAKDLRYLPILAVVSVFIPILNLIIPFRALWQIARWSDPSLADRHPAGSQRGGPISLGWAWAAFFNLYAFNGEISRFIRENVKIPVGAIEVLSAQLQAFLWVQFLLALCFVVRGINAAQLERHLRLSAEPTGSRGE